MLTLCKTNVLCIQENMCGQRGLLPDTEQQTFAMALPRRLRQRYESVLLPAQLEVNIVSIPTGLT